MTAADSYGPLVPGDHLGVRVQLRRDRPRSLSALLRVAAQRWPEREAVRARAATLTYADLDRAVDAAVAALAEVGLDLGSRFAVALDHDLPFAAVPHVASRAGALAQLLGSTLPPERWATQLVRGGIATVVADAAHRDAARAALDLAGLPGARVLDAADLLPPDALGDPAEAAPAPDDELRPLAGIGTSGTTGVPKTALVTSRGLVHAALAYVDLLDLDAGEPDGPAAERSLLVLPLASIGPLSAQTTAMPLVGGTLVVAEDPRPTAAVAAMAAYAITHLDAVPAWLGLLARAPGDDPLPAWRTLIYGGAPMPAATAAALQRRWPAVALYDVWGLSETHGPATALRVDADRPVPAGTVGRPVAGVEVRAVDATGSPLPPGRVGELEVAAANVAPGYLDDAATTARVVVAGRLRTGDLGTVAADGTVRILDRAKDVILRGGANVFSVEVEQVLCAVDGVAEAAVWGVPDGLGGEAVAAAVVLERGRRLDAGALRREVAGRIGVHAVPRRVVAVDVLPRNATGKIDKLRLREAGR